MGAAERSLKAVIDTNILIDYLAGIDLAVDELGLYQEPSISLITWMEVMVGARPAEDGLIRNFLLRFQVVPIDREVAEEAVRIRQDQRLRLPDSIIWATALSRGQILVTRNTRDFPADHPGIRVPYKLAGP